MRTDAVMIGFGSLLLIVAVVLDTAIALGDGGAASDPAAAAILEASIAAADEARDLRAMRRIESPPLGLPPVPIPAGNRPTPEKIALGRKLFFDRRLSINSTMSCGMCHIPEQGFTNNELARPIGVGGRSLRRNAPTVLNTAYIAQAFHDGRRPSLEAQVADPLIDPREMANPDMEAVVARIDGLDDYDGDFERAFGAAPSPERIAQALASWERTLLAGDSPFDRWRFGGETNALTAEQVRGFELFTGDAGCAVCHRIGEKDARFTDDLFHDTGIGYVAAEIVSRDTSRVWVEIEPGVSVPVSRETIRSVGDPPEVDRGRFEVTNDPGDLWRFKTPSLRNVAFTAPYMHDGSLRSLEDVVRYYDRGGILHDGLDPRILPLGLNEREIRALVAFLESLTSPSIGELVQDARSVGVGN